MIHRAVIPVHLSRPQFHNAYSMHWWFAEVSDQWCWQDVVWLKILYDFVLGHSQILVANRLLPLKILELLSSMISAELLTNLWSLRLRPLVCVAAMSRHEAKMQVWVSQMIVQIDDDVLRCCGNALFWDVSILNADLQTTCLKQWSEESWICHCKIVQDQWHDPDWDSVEMIWLRFSFFFFFRSSSLRFLCVLNMLACSEMQIFLMMLSLCTCTDMLRVAQFRSFSLRCFQHKV